MTDMSGDTRDEYVDTGEMIEPLFVFLQKRMPDGCFYLFSKDRDRGILSTRTLPPLSADAREDLLGRLSHDGGGAPGGYPRDGERECFLYSRGEGGSGRFAWDKDP